MDEFSRKNAKFWPAIEWLLRQRGINPTAAFEAEKSRRLGLHHDAALAGQYLSAAQEAESAGVKAKRASKLTGERLL